MVSKAPGPSSQACEYRSPSWPGMQWGGSGVALLADIPDITFSCCFAFITGSARIRVHLGESTGSPRDTSSLRALARVRKWIRKGTSWNHGLLCPGVFGCMCSYSRERQ